MLRARRRKIIIWIAPLAAALWLQAPRGARADLTPGPPYDVCNRLAQGSACDDNGQPGVCLVTGKSVWDMKICIPPAVVACGKVAPTGAKIVEHGHAPLDMNAPVVEEIGFQIGNEGDACVLDGHAGRCESVAATSLFAPNAIACVTHPERDHEEAETKKLATWQSEHRAHMRRDSGILAISALALAACAYLWRGRTRRSP